ncbi:MAG: DUF2892 domain-containing protein [Phycisphaerae bacterium]
MLSPNQLSSWSHRVLDVRERDEFASARLAGPCECVPLATLASAASGWDRDRPLLLVCKSGMRARKAAEQLESLGFRQVHVLEGGLDACRKAGVPLAGGGPIPIVRQVMITAGLLLLAGLGLALLHPTFLAIDVVIAAGLTFSGITGVCPMARLLERMPWNRALSSSGGSCSC